MAIQLRRLLREATVRGGGYYSEAATTRRRPLTEEIRYLYSKTTFSWPFPGRLMQVSLYNTCTVASSFELRRAGG